MATRLLLTLLALVAGLAAQLTPAQARGGANVDVEISATANLAADQRQSAPRLSWHGGSDAQVRCMETGVRPLAKLEVLAAPVLPGIDRARE
jgi:hypothetical protein